MTQGEACLRFGPTILPVCRPVDRALSGSALSGGSSRRYDIVLHCWKRVVEVMEEITPALVFGRLPEAFRMALQGVPPDEQKVSVIDFDAAPEFMPLVTQAGGDDLLSL